MLSKCVKSMSPVSQQLLFFSSPHQSGCHCPFLDNCEGLHSYLFCFCLLFFIFFKNVFILNWMTMTVPYCIGFCINRNQPQVSLCPLPLESPSPPLPTPLGCLKHSVWSPQVTQQIPTSCLTYGSYVCFHHYSLLFATWFFSQQPKSPSQNTCILNPLHKVNANHLPYKKPSKSWLLPTSVNLF